MTPGALLAEPWIRVHANVSAKPVVWRAVEALGISRAEAVGLLVSFWGSVSQHTTNGAVAHLSDAQLEDWAGWSRKRGKFAAFIRTTHLDEEGRVNEWDEYAGVLEEQRRKSRKRKRKSLGRDREEDVNSQGIHSEVREPPHLRDETRRNDTELQHLQPLTAAELEAEAGLAVLLETDADRNALTAIVLRAEARGACIAALRSMLTGNDSSTPQPTPAVFGQALRDLAANGQRMSARLFRGYLRDVAVEQVRAHRGVPPSGAGATSATGARRENWTDKQERKERESGEREIVRIKWGNVEQRIHAREDGEAWWARMQREAKDAGRNPVLYADERRNESAEEPSHV